MLVLSKFIHKFATGNSKNYHPMLKDFQKELIPIADEDLFVVLNHPNANFDYPEQNSLPVIFYGNSVTQGAAASRSGNTFPNVVSKKLKYLLQLEDIEFVD